MSSCFLCDCSCQLHPEDDRYTVYIGTDQAHKLMKQLPIMVGSSGTGLNDQQHSGNGQQNYVSYRVKKIEFCCVIDTEVQNPYTLPDYILIFKVPFREPIFNYYFQVFRRFMLYSEPECVLGYKVRSVYQFGENKKSLDSFKIDINKPFILGPNEYLGVLYMISENYLDLITKIDASAKVWFDIA